MYRLEQKSLKEYTIKANDSLIYILDKYVSYGETEQIETNELAEDEVYTLILPSDGMYVLTIEVNGNLNKYFIHNISELLNRRQSFITDHIINHVTSCTSRHYYDYITFNLLFDVYIRLVETTFGNGYTSATAIASNDVIYRINYLFELLQRY